MTHPPPPPDDRTAATRFRVNLFRVMAVQVVTLILLWLLQSRFTV